MTGIYIYYLPNFTYIWLKSTVNVDKYTSPMDPMDPMVGFRKHPSWSFYRGVGSTFIEAVNSVKKEGKEPGLRGEICENHVPFVLGGGRGACYIQSTLGPQNYKKSRF